MKHMISINTNLDLSIFKNILVGNYCTYYVCELIQHLFYFLQDFLMGIHMTLEAFLLLFEACTIYYQTVGSYSKY